MENCSATTRFRKIAEANGMSSIELMAFVDQFHWFPRTHPHCATTCRGRNLKRNGYKGFFEAGTTYNMDIVYSYIESHELGLNEFLKTLDELSIARDELELELYCERTAA